MVNRPLVQASRRVWTADEDAILRARYPYDRTEAIATALGRSLSSVYQRARKLGVAKSAAYLASPAACRTNGRQGIGSRFPRGHRTWNKGTAFRAGGRSVDTQFKAGERHGVAVRLYHQPIGTERISKDGSCRQEHRNHARPRGPARMKALGLALNQTGFGDSA